MTETAATGLYVIAENGNPVSDARMIGKAASEHTAKELTGLNIE
ncbi:hypothetical protein [Saccharibacillus deserti]|nr:hypothetical protein [Saccharibacillus deserti]